MDDHEHPGGGTRVEFATGAIRNQILTGGLPANVRVHINETAAQLGMSPIPIREALRALASEGLLEAVPQRGYRVRPTSRADLEETYRLRLLLDPLATTLAVKNLTSADLTRLDTTLSAFELATKAGDWQILRRHHRDLHFGLYQASQSGWLLRFISALWENSERYQWLAPRVRGLGPQRTREHERILETCRAGDAESAGWLMREHLTRTRDAAMKLVAPP